MSSPGASLVSILQVMINFDIWNIWAHTVEWQGLQARYHLFMTMEMCNFFTPSRESLNNVVHILQKTANIFQIEFSKRIFMTGIVLSAISLKCPLQGLIDCMSILDHNPFPEQIFHHYSNLMENWFMCTSIVEHHIATKFCICHNSKICHEQNFTCR